VITASLAGLVIAILAYILAIWREYMEQYDAGLGYPKEAAGIRWRSNTTPSVRCALPGTA
jgi:hypothetical protein